ncbi:MAG TPA: SDR family oxidoreductase [Kofleriaceae bacterium]|nr:SDR family oxidoreductase [Kofleriaceae bacterium]
MTRDRGGSSNGGERGHHAGEPDGNHDGEPDGEHDDGAEDRITRPEVVLVTGFPAFSARRMALEILARDGEARVFLLARAKFADAARELAASLPPAQGARIEVIEGDVCDMDLGLSGREYATLAGEITSIQHMAGIYYMGVDRATARRVNIDGTRGVIELAGDAARLRRLVHWSTAAVSGRRKGVILEEELDEGQSFHNVYEETKFEAEKLVRAAQRSLPITILRPGIVVGDSTTGEIDKLDGPYYLMVLLSTNLLQMRMQMPGKGTAPLHLVPIDFVTAAGYRLWRDERAVGRTFHLTDPNPLPARRVYQLVAELSEGKVARGFLPAGLARTLLRTPGLERLTRSPMGSLESFDRPCFYNCRNAMALLQEDGTSCPPFDSYAENLVQYVRGVHARQQKLDDEVFDPFD